MSSKNLKNWVLVLAIGLVAASCGKATSLKDGKFTFTDGKTVPISASSLTSILNQANNHMTAAVSAELGGVSVGDFSTSKMRAAQIKQLACDIANTSKATVNDPTYVSVSFAQTVPPYSTWSQDCDQAGNSSATQSDLCSRISNWYSQSNTFAGVYKNAATTNTSAFAKKQFIVLSDSESTNANSIRNFGVNLKCSGL
jgi:hypothetical protein